MTLLMTMLTTNAKCSSNKWPHSCSWQLLMKIADDIDDSVHNKCQMSNQQIASFTFLTLVDDSVHNVCWWQYSWQLPNSKFPHSCRWQLLWVMMITFHTFCGFSSNWKLHYFPTVRAFVTGVTSHISHIYKGINAMLISRGPIKPYKFWIKIILAIFLENTRPDKTIFSALTNLTIDFDFELSKI